jgi:hypothetical protein
MFDSRIPASMAAIPSRKHSHLTEEDCQPLSAHAIRMEQMRAYTLANKARDEAQRQAIADARLAKQAFYQANSEALAAERRAKYHKDKQPVDKIAVQAQKITRIVHDTGPRLVILVRNSPKVYKPTTPTAQRHYAACKTIVGTYAPGIKWETIADDIRAVK